MFTYMKYVLFTLIGLYFSGCFEVVSHKTEVTQRLCKASVNHFKQDVIYSSGNPGYQFQMERNIAHLWYAVNDLERTIAKGPLTWPQPNKIRIGSRVNYIIDWDSEERFSLLIDNAWVVLRIPQTVSMSVPACRE